MYLVIDAEDCRINVSSMGCGDLEVQNQAGISVSGNTG
jgi:hypothetical protein